MARKDFPFDFDEDADPVDEIHRLRVASTRHFKTTKDYLAYLRATPTAEEMIAELDAEIAKQEAKSTKPAKRPASRRRKAVVHA